MAEPLIGYDALYANPQLLRTGDIVHEQSTGIISRGIRWFTRAKGEKRTWASHTEMIYGPTEDGMILSAGAMMKGIEIHDLRRYYEGRKANLVIMRHPSPKIGTDQATKILQLAMRADEGKSYPYYKIALHAIDKLLFGERYVARRLAFDDRNYCTAAVTKWLRSIGIGLPYDLDEIQPDDLLDLQMRMAHEIIWASSEKALKSLRKIYG